jgi:hypothetical protein
VPSEVVKMEFAMRFLLKVLWRKVGSENMRMD